MESKFEIQEIVPSEEELSIIKKTTGDKENYLVAWAAHTSDGELARSNIAIGKLISIKINCAASKLLVQLEARYRVELIAIDARSLRPERLYSLIDDQQVKSAYFQISYTTEATLKGLFKLQVMLSIPKTDMFQVYEGDYFQVA